MQRDSMFRGNNNDCRIYIGNLPEDFRERDVEKLFQKYGEIADVRVKKGDSRRGDPRDRRGSRDDRNLAYAFIQFDDPRDAEEAVHGRDGCEVEGVRIRVEFTKSGQNNYRSRGNSRFQSRGRGRGVPPKRSNHRVNVKGLPPTGSWQDLKDHMREAGEVLYAEVYGDGSGIVEFAHSDDVTYALKNLSDTDFRSHEGESGTLTVFADGYPRDNYGGRSRSRSRSRGRRSRSSSHGRYKSRSKSPANDRSRSSSRSPRKHSKSPRERSKSPRERSRSPEGG